LDPEKAPTDWDDFLKTCEILKEHGITPISSGNNRPFTTDFIRRTLVSAFFSSDEIKNFYQQGRGIASEEYRIIMNFCLTLRKNEYLDPDGIFRPYFNYSPDSFKDGKCAMTIGLLSDIAHWKTFSDNIGKDNLGYFPNLVHPKMKNPGVQLLQNAGLVIGINKNSPNKELAYKYLKNMYSKKSLYFLEDELGMLVPVKGQHLPAEDYPVLKDIEKSLKNTGVDLEQYTKSTYIRNLLYRYDNLLFNSMEISIDDYIQRVYNNLKLF
ncbi:MAG: extracellular solute-binding protein, partial [Spirochaetales bacterium]|nr:extracellular solute-binding protein [Spirochaetales bacterium]